MTGRKLETALELADLAEQMERERLRRAHPDESDDEIERRVLAWLRTRPGAEDGDAAGRVISLPRTR